MNNPKGVKQSQSLSRQSIGCLSSSLLWKNMWNRCVLRVTVT